MSDLYLVATDGSEQARKAELYAMNLLDDPDEVLLVHVVPNLPADVMGDDYDPAEMDGALTEAGERLLEESAERFRTRGFDPETVLLHGETGPRLREHARDRGADGIVVGRRGRGPVSDFLLGSVSNYLIHHAPCAVIVVPATPEGG